MGLVIWTEATRRCGCRGTAGRTAMDVAVYDYVPGKDGDGRRQSNSGHWESCLVVGGPMLERCGPRAINMPVTRERKPMRTASLGWAPLP